MAHVLQFASKNNLIAKVSLVSLQVLLYLQRLNESSTFTHFVKLDFS